MSSNEETSEESQAYAEMEKEHQSTRARRVRCGLPFFLLFYIVARFSPLPPYSAGLSDRALSPFEVLQPFSPLSINQKRKLIAF